MTPEWRNVYHGIITQLLLFHMREYKGQSLQDDGYFIPCFPLVDIYGPSGWNPDIYCRCSISDIVRLNQTAVSLQMGTNKCASQSGMTAYGTRRHLYDPKNQILPPMDHSTISLQMGTNKCASQVRTLTKCLNLCFNFLKLFLKQVGGFPQDILWLFIGSMLTAEIQHQQIVPFW